MNVEDGNNFLLQIYICHVLLGDRYLWTKELKMALIFNGTR